AAGRQLEPDVERVRPEPRRLEPRGEAREDAPEHDLEGGKRVELPLEPLRLLPERRRRPRAEGLAVPPAGEVVGGEPRRAEPRGDAGARQRGELAEGPQAPAPEGLRELLGKLELGDRKSTRLNSS